ncbi:MAG: ATP-binding protein [Nitrospirota bacterium]|nr:ATP-binding protein [Nitrospirota bacterium]
MSQANRWSPSGCAKPLAAFPSAWLRTNPSKGLGHAFLNGHEASDVLRACGQICPWELLFNTPNMASAELDRHLHRSTIINICGYSYRLREKRQAGRSLP